MNPLEAMAKAIYAKWDKLPGWVPWVDGGNSDMQHLARDCARAARDALADNVSKKMKKEFSSAFGNGRSVEQCIAAAIRAAGEG